MTNLPLSPARSGRIAAVDIARGVAIVAMVLYHATWDLGPDFFHFIDVNAATNPVLRASARAIASTFMFLVGVSLVLAHRDRFRPRAFFRRFAIIACAALIVTGVTWLAMGDYYVRFGILHGIAAASLIGALFLRAPAWLSLIAGVAALAAPMFLASTAFDRPEWLWLGLSTYVPAMLDYVPVLPWVGATMLGVGLTRIALAAGLDGRLSRAPPRNALSRALVWCGRWSLAIYIIHQPLLLGAIYLIALATSHPMPDLF